MALKKANFPRKARLTKSAQILAVLRNGKRVRMEHLELRGLASRLHPVRVGVIVPKHRHTAVERNRLKRQLRELVRIHVLGTVQDVQLVVRAAPAAYDASLEQLTSELTGAVDQLLLEQ